MNRIKKILLIAFFLSLGNAWAQSADSVAVDTNKYTAPTFPGGEEAMFTYIEEELVKTISNFVRVNPLGDQFVVRFRIDKFGDMNNFNITSSSNYAIDRYLKRVFINMPPWEPGTINGVKATLQLEYSLEIKPLGDGYGYVVTENRFTYKPDASTKTLKTILIVAAAGIFLYLFLK